jgi:hypothetical protein
VDPLEPEPEGTFRHAPLIARSASVFSQPGLGRRERRRNW